MDAQVDDLWLVDTFICDDARGDPVLSRGGIEVLEVGRVTGVLLPILRR